MYSSLDYLPIKIYQKINSNNDYSLLLEKDDSDKFIPNSMLEKTWNKLVEEYNERFLKIDSVVDKIRSEISHLNTKRMTVSICCESLRFEWNDELVQIIIDNGFSLTDGPDYFQQLETIERQLSGIEIKINRLSDSLPKKSDDDEIGEPLNIDDVLASFSSVLNIDFDFNTISVTKFFSLQKQVDKKVEILKKQLSKK